MAQLSFLTYLRGIYNLNLTKSHKVHSAIIQAIYDCFIMARNDIDIMRLEMCLSTAHGYWLDCWGEYFSVYRKSEETDEHYAKRIIDSVIQPKSTIPAVKDYIVDYLNSEYNKNYTREDVSIKEPWKDLAKYSHKGTLSNTTRFFSGDYWCHAVMDISVPEEITQDLIDLVNSVKAAGVKVIWSILNSYDIVSGFNTADDAYAAYSRHIQTQTKRHMFGGLVLSNTSPFRRLSGSRETWFMITSYYQWYAYIQDKNTDDSIILTKKDLIGLLDYYREYEEVFIKDLEDNLFLSKDGIINEKLLSGSQQKLEINEKLVKITDEMLLSLELMDSFLELSYRGRISTSEGVMFDQLASHELFKKLVIELERFKAINRDYYNAVQPPILNGERAMWLVTRNENWLWNTPTMTHQDFFELWEPFGDEIEHTINSITEFEDAYDKGYITFGDKYQPPVVVSDKFYWTPQMVQDWLYSSPAFAVTDLESIYQRQFNRIYGTLDMDNVTLEDIINLEKSNFEKYSTAREVQPPIDVIPMEPPNPYNVVIGYNNTPQASANYSKVHTYDKVKKAVESLCLSSPTSHPVLSGNQKTFTKETTNTNYSYNVKVTEYNTDNSVIITREDLFGLLDYYTEYEKEVIGENLILSDNGVLSADKLITGTEYLVVTHEIPTELTQQAIDSLAILKTFLIMSNNGQLSTETGKLSEYLLEHDLYNKLVAELVRFKENNPEYYNSVQAPIQLNTI